MKKIKALIFVLSLSLCTFPLGIAMATEGAGSTSTDQASSADATATLPDGSTAADAGTSSSATPDSTSADPAATPTDSTAAPTDTTAPADTTTVSTDELTQLINKLQTILADSNSTGSADSPSKTVCNGYAKGRVVRAQDFLTKLAAPDSKTLPELETALNKANFVNIEKLSEALDTLPAQFSKEVALNVVWFMESSVNIIERIDQQNTAEKTSDSDKNDNGNSSAPNKCAGTWKNHCNKAAGNSCQTTKGTQETSGTQAASGSQATSAAAPQKCQKAAPTITKKWAAPAPQTATPAQKAIKANNQAKGVSAAKVQSSFNFGKTSAHSSANCRK